MSKEEKAGRETACGPPRDPSFMKEFQAMLDEGDCAEMMARMRAMCCGPSRQSEPGPSEEQEETVREKTTQP